MKKFLKGCLIAAGGLCAAGILMIIVCGLCGGHQVFAQALTNNEFSFGPIGYRVRTLVPGTDDWHDEWHELTDDAYDDYDEEMDALYDAYEEAMDDAYDEHEEKMDASHDYSDAPELMLAAAQDQVQNLELKIGAAQLQIKESDDAQYWVRCDAVKRMECYMDGDTLVLEGLKGVGKDGNHNDKIYLYVPAGVRLDDVDIELGAGRITVERLQCEELDAAVGAGQIQCFDTNVGNLELKIGGGQADYKGIVQQDIEVKCTAGQVNLMLQGRETDWNYELKCAAGEIMLEDTGYSNLLNTVSIDHNAPKNCEIECALGQIKAAFYQ